MTRILHNPRCQKSRAALEILKEHQMDFTVIDYLKEPPTRDELGAILDMLGLKPYELIRKGEPIFKEKFKDKNYPQSEWLDILVSYPKLIERPIVIKNGKAVIGRPPEAILDIL